MTRRYLRRLCIVKAKDRDRINKTLADRPYFWGPNTFSRPISQKADPTKITHYAADILLDAAMVNVLKKLGLKDAEIVDEPKKPGTNRLREFCNARDLSPK